MNLKQYITTLIALFLGLFLSKAQTADSLAFKLEQDSTDINAFVNASVNKNLFWKQQVLSNAGGAVVNLSLEIPTVFSAFKPSAYDAYTANTKPFDYSHNYKFSQIDYKTTIEDGQYISALHTQAYENFSFGVYYQKLLSLGSFKRDRKDHVNTEFRINYHPKNKNYSTSFNLSHQISEVHENGGFHNDSIYINSTVLSNDVIPTQLSAAENTLKNTSFNWYNAYKLTSSKGVNLTIESNTTYRRETELYVDDNPLFIPSNSGLADTIPYYSHFYSDSTSTRDSIGFSQISQEFLLNTTYKSFELKPYIKLANLNYKLGFNKQSTTQLQLGVYAQGFEDKFKARLALKNRKDISTTGIELTTFVNPIKPLEIELYYDEKAPDLFYQRYESNHFRWDNDFSREKHLRLQADLKLLKTTSLRAFYHQIDGYTFLNENAHASQTSLKQGSQGLELNSIIKKGKFTFSNQFLYQQTTGDYIQLPSFVGRIKIAYQNKMLGEALVQPGIQLNYSSKYYAPRYMTALSNFYFQNENKVGGAFLVDIFVNMRIANFTIYGVVSNLLQNQMLNENFVSPNYVGPIQQFNFGIRWNFYDK